MTLRTPRRRISPRTKRRYKAIREFFRRALGSSSQSQIKISSSIAVNVTDLKHKIIGLERQLDEVSRHCHDLSCLESSFRCEADGCRDQPSCSKHALDPEQAEHRQIDSGTTRVLYKNSETLPRKFEDSDYVDNCDCGNCSPRPTTHVMNDDRQNTHSTRVKKKKSRHKEHGDECDPALHRHKARSAVENFNSAYSTSYHSLHQTRLDPSDTAELTKSRPRHSRQQGKHREFIDGAALEEGRRETYKEHKMKSSHTPITNEDDSRGKSGKNKKDYRLLDQEFISDIIKRQYRPVKLFGRRESGMSQFSAPVCRDQEYPIRENIREDADLCSCGRGRQSKHRSKYVCDYDLSDMRSICDTRLYSSKRCPRPRHRRRHIEVYNDSDLYDLIPVKEKSSPKSRRKFVEDNTVGYDYYREVPPSPRTLRPRLNLKAQHVADYDDYITHVNQQARKNNQQRPKKQQEYFVQDMESDITSEYVVVKSRRDKHKNKPVKVQANLGMQQDTATSSSLQYITLVGNPAHSQDNETSLNKTHDSDLSDKTLCEIKDILQNFLQEIKKDSPPQKSPPVQPTHKLSPRQASGHAEEKGTSISDVPPNGQNNFSYSVPPQRCPTTGFMPQFSSPCCYPVMPVCPMQKMHNPHNFPPNGYRVPSATCTCHACTATARENTCHDCHDCSKNKPDCAGLDAPYSVPTKRSETDELIKEIYKFVANSNTPRRKAHDRHRDKMHRREEHEEKVLTSRSVGESVRMLRHDAKVGTPTTKCYSKSCEAIGSRMASDTYYTSATQSDTILEKLSLEATQSESELSAEYTIEKGKKGKFTRKLRNFLFKKKKKETIEELSESASSLEVKPRKTRARSPSPPPPFPQKVTNYMMHGEEYYHPPPVGYPPRHDDPYPLAYRTPMYDRHYYPPPVHELYSPHHVHGQTIHEHAVAGHYAPEHRAHSHRAPYYEPHSSRLAPQVPLCLKEIEVKSTSTQSERKTSLFKKFAMRPQPQPEQPTFRSEQPTTMRTERPRLFSPAKQYAEQQDKPGLLAGWKKLQAKAEMQAQAQQLARQQKHKLRARLEDPFQFQMKTQNELALGDEKMRNAMLKKLFYKRNPFSPNNLIIKTIMGRDPASFGEPNLKMRPRLLF